MRSLEAVLSDALAIAHIHEAGTGHFAYTSKRHGNGHADWKPLIKRAHQDLLDEIAVKLLQTSIYTGNLDPKRPIMVIGPETVGLHLAAALARLSCQKQLEDIRPHIRQLFKDNRYPTGFRWDNHPSKELMAESQIILLDDQLNQGSTVRKVLSMTGHIEVVATIGSWMQVSPEELGVNCLVALREFPGLETFEPGEERCPLCKNGVPIVRHPGHGHEYQRVHPEYHGGFVDHPISP